MRYAQMMIALVLMMAFAVTPVWAETELDTIQQNLMCQCGCTMVLYSCDCGTAEQMRGEIKTMLGEGKTPQQVLDYYVGKYGEKVLSAPTKQGFNLTAYITPFVGIVVAGSSIFLVLRQWVFRGKGLGAEVRSASATGPEPKPQAGRTNLEDLRAELARDLENYD